jgi:hypothetical protein
MGRGVSRAGRALAAVPVLVALAGCGGGSSTVANPGGGESSPTATPSSGSGTTVADPSHAVSPPGAFRPPLRSADILVFGQHPLSDARVQRIRHLAGVTGVLRFSLAQVSINDHAVNVAAVDPASYRSFNPYPVATFQQEWSRVAGGEMSLRPRFHRQVAKDGYVRMGAGSDAPQIHVGAFAPQIPQVDAVVNTSWVKPLGMRPGNALLVSTGIQAPGRIRGPLQRIVGNQASVQRMDVAARLGLDPSVSQTALPAGSVADAVGSYSYRVLSGGRIVPDPAWVASHISTETMPIIGAMTCNTQMFPQLRAALDEIVARGLAHTIHPQQYEGCYVPKFIEGTTTLSNHAFGLAFDLNVPENERGTPGQMNRTVVAIFEHWGFTWGGTWHWTDPMHFEMNRLIHPG